MSHSPSPPAKSQFLETSGFVARIEGVAAALEALATAQPAAFRAHLEAVEGRR